MTLRDYFAAAALQSLAAATMEDTLKRGRDPNKANHQLCHGCYAIADAMLAARERKEVA